jgi:hypothetical protein
VGCPEEFGFHLVTDSGDMVGDLRIQEEKDGDTSFILDIGGIESIVESAEEVQEQLAARGFELVDLADAEKVAQAAKSYGVRVWRDPNESARFRMKFVSGKRNGWIVEVDVRADGTPAKEIPDNWLPMKQDVPGPGERPGDVVLPMDTLFSLLASARTQGRNDPVDKPSPELAAEWRDIVDGTLADLGLGWFDADDDED